MTDDTPATAAVRAALETAHWYSVDRTGRATQCVDAQDAHDNAACNARDWPAVAPHRAMQLIDAAPVAAMLAELDRLRSETDAKRDQIVRLMADIEAFGAALLKAERERDRLRDDRDCEKRLRKDAEEVREDAIAERDRLAAEVALWQSLYRRAINEANGLTNYVEDRAELRRAERKLSAIEQDARTATASEAKP